MNRRLGLTRFFVPDASFHWYIRIVGLGALGIGAFFGSLSWWYHHRLLQSLGIFDNTSIQQAVGDFALYSVIITAIASVGTVLFITLLSLFLLHRIAGPIYRLKQHMLGIMMGRPVSELRFRRDDQLSDLSATFNEFLRHIGQLEDRPEAADVRDAAADREDPLAAGAEPSP